MAKPRKQTYTMDLFLKNLKEQDIRQDQDVQRLSDQWSNGMMNELLVTVLNDGYIPPIILGQEENSQMWLIDGLQRSTTLMKFMYGNYKITTAVEEPFITYRAKCRDSEGNVMIDGCGDIVWEDRQVDIRLTPQGKESTIKNALMVEEEMSFLRAAENQSYYLQYALILQTGIRVGELAGLRWADVDFENRILHISRTMSRLNGELLVGTPKSKSGIRDINLTSEAVRILRKAEECKRNTKVSSIQFYDTIFVTKNGRPIDRNNYDDALKKISQKNNLPHISMHTLRHTFATRCIEAGMKPKTLQNILGHSKINITMDIYVHVTKEELSKERACVEQALKVV